ncbi:MAG: SUMF1/EgtB/PvdO family nonheme iron enzyme [Planctomycetes bacterium]|nr:SUMF1/EgtB/PvdO family nonheme iron enzyme [Planctomycetota bacterium]
MKTPDKMLARLAIERGLVTEEKLQAFLQELDDPAHAESLAKLLRERGVLDEAQHRALTSEHARQMRVLERYSDIQRADASFGEFLVLNGLAENEAVKAGLSQQGAERTRGRVRRLANILVERGSLDRPTLLAALHQMGIKRLVCATCAAPSPVDAVLAGQPLCCGTCHGPLVDEATFIELRRDRLPMPDEARIAGQVAERQYGKFVLVQHLGSGGMGAVWKAWDRELGRWVAIKLLRSVYDPSRRDEDICRFMREASLVARLRHPNIVSVYESEEIKAQHLIVMEYIDGKPLNHLRFSPRRALEIIRDAARAVQYAHDQGIVHRDIKPGNVMVTPSGQVYVMDFGLARSLSAPSTLTQSGFVLGTPMYMAPEQAMAVRDRKEKLCDVYALGATLYDILTGRAPFDAEQPWDVIADVINTEPVPPRQRNPDIPRDAETITLKAMHKRYSQRYASAGEMADDIDRFLRGEPILASPTPMVERVWRAAKRRAPLVIAAGAATIAVMGSLLGLASVRAREARERAGAAAVQVGDARAAVEMYRKARKALASLEKTLNETDDLADEDRRKMEVDARALERTLEEAFTKASGSCRQALGQVENLPEARDTLADLFWEWYLLGEERASADLAMREALVRTYGAAQYGVELDAQARLWLQTSPSGADVIYRPYRPREDGCLFADESQERSLGKTPLKGVQIGRGSGLLLARLEGYPETRVPILVGRGEEKRLEVPLYKEAEIPKGFVYVPSGPYIMGGDPSVARPRGRRVVDVKGFFIAIHEVTYDEYVEFLNAEGAPELIPRNIRGDPLVQLGTDGRYHVIEGASGWPVQGVPWRGAKVYCEWKSKSPGGFMYRLPASVEWEKAARGVDGRRYPWGNVFDWSFTHGMLSDQPVARWPRPVGKTPGDVSVYGACDMAGNVAEWCVDSFPWREPAHLIRGGAFAQDTLQAFRCASWDRAVDDYPQASHGFRVAVSAAR